MNVKKGTKESCQLCGNSSKLKAVVNNLNVTKYIMAPILVNHLRDFRFRETGKKLSNKEIFFYLLIFNTFLHIETFRKGKKNLDLWIAI